jgi:hypothetical protein
MCLIKPFTEAEIKTGLDQMKTNSAQDLMVYLQTFTSCLGTKLKNQYWKCLSCFIREN